MDTHLQQLLRSLCLNTEWNYAVFWKLRHRARMVLTLEDAYCETLGSLLDGQICHDALGLAVAKMSCHVYSLGEGIIGQVAVTGKHQWICAGEHAVNLLSSSEHCDVRQAQLLAGIQTVVVAAVVPHGVVQLGSMSKVNEDLKLLSHLRNLFSSLQDSTSTHVSNSMQQSLHSLMHTLNTPLSADTLHGCQLDPSKDVTGENPYVSLQKQGGDSSISEDLENAKLARSIYQKEESKVENGNILQKVTSASQNYTESQNSYDALLSANKFGYELDEALGAAFLKQNYPSWCEAEKSEPVTVSGIEDGMEESMLTSDTVTDHLLEAVISSSCHKDSTFKRVKSFSSYADSLLTTEKMIEPSSNTSHTVSSACYTIDGSTVTEESIKHCLTSSDSYSMRTSKGNKKRARPSEKCRPPRPRDRQLIEERIKELRELVPNGSKCSIDSLLQRTIKHTLFLQSISKHADKLDNCARSRVNKDGCSSSEQGASWAVEVGSHMKICPIVVKNLNVDGLLLIEMLYEDCYQFLKIFEAVRGLGLTILKGITEAHEDKTWLRFVVEGQNKRNMHRMDVLLSLIHILQTETAI